MLVIRVSGPKVTVHSASGFFKACRRIQPGLLVPLSSLSRARPVPGQSFQARAPSQPGMRPRLLASGTPISCIYMEYSMYIPCICRPDRYPWNIHVYPWIYHIYPSGWIYVVYTWISMYIHHVYTTYIHGYTS